MLSNETLARLRQFTARPPRSEPAQTAPRSRSSRTQTTENGELPAGNEIENDRGRHWLIEQPLEDIWRGANRHLAQLAAGIENPSAGDAETEVHAELRQLAAALPRHALYLDLETCGFAGSAIFLAGVLHTRGDQLVLSQLLARDYSQEAAMLASLWNIAAGKRVLCTFNGKSFDWPCVLDRSTLHKLGDGRQTGERSRRRGGHPRVDLAHCDLLHHARRRWKGRLPNCRLQTLEQYVCGRRRVGDIPGSEIPAVYHRYVRTGDARELRLVLQHNALDLVTLLQLSLLLATASERRPV